MMHFNATKAKSHFGELMDSARHEPVLIDKNGRSVVVMISSEEYKRLQDIEDGYWLLKAEIAKNNGFLTEAKSTALLHDMLTV